VKDGERLRGGVGRPRLRERGVAGRGVGDIAGDKFDKCGTARGEVWPSGLAQVEDADVRGVFTTMEEVKDDPTADKPCLRKISAETSVRQEEGAHTANNDVPPSSCWWKVLENGMRTVALLLHAFEQMKHLPARDTLR
jgi:hypothetical protein